MTANPHINSGSLAKLMMQDINAIRDDIARKSRESREQEPSNHISYRAYLLQAAKAMTVLKQITGLWTDSYAALLREEKEAPTTEAVELRYSKDLSKFLETHLEQNWLLFGGRAGEIEKNRTETLLDAKINTQAAKRHHAEIVGYCDHFISRLLDRASELEFPASRPSR